MSDAISVLVERAGIEDVFDPACEDAGDFERERQARGILAALERDDGLSRDADGVGKIGLR